MGFIKGQKKQTLSFLNAIIDNNKYKNAIFCRISVVYGKAHGGLPVAPGAYPAGEPVISSSMQYGGALDHDEGGSATLADGHKTLQVLCCYDVGG